MIGLRSILFCGVASAASATTIADRPLDEQKDNVMRVTAQDCDGCTTMDNFTSDHPLVSVLFYERPLSTPHKYKESIRQGFLNTCRVLRWSKVVCGVVDMVDDRAYALHYIDPKTAPAHIALRNGSPVANQKHHIERLMAKPGDTETMHWHLRDLLVPEDVDALETLTILKDAKQLSKLFKRHKVVIVLASASAGKVARDRIRTTVRHLYLGGGSIGEPIPWMLPAEDLAPPLKRGTKVWKQWEKRQRKRRVVAVLLQGAEAIQAYEIPDLHVVGFVGGKPARDPQPFIKGTDTVDGQVLKTVIVDAVVQAAKTLPEAQASPSKDDL